MEKGPSVDIYGIQDNSLAENRIEVIDEVNFEFKQKWNKDGIYLIKNAEKIKLKKCESSIHNDIFHRFPTLTYLYKYIEESLKEYINNLKEEIKNET